MAKRKKEQKSLKSETPEGPAPLNRVLDLAMLPIESLKPSPKNRNKHPEEQIERLVELIKYQGFRQPIIVSNQSGFVVVGHGRLEAAKRAGLTHVPVVGQDFESEEQEHAFQISDNAIASWAELDLSAINTDLADMGPDFDIDMLAIRNFVLEPAEKDLGDPDNVPGLPAEPRTKKGDVYVLGNHRLICGDSTSPTDLEKLMQGKLSDLCVTDPPYNVNYGADGNKNPAGWAQGKHRLIENDNMSRDDFRDFCKSWISIIAIANDGCIYCFGPPGPDGRVMFTELDESFHCSTTGVWVKDSLVLGRGKYHNRYEPFWFGWNTTGNKFTDDRTLTNVFEFKRPRSSDLHPTMKPVELITKCIEDGSKPGQVVLDIFGGSGTTMIACEAVNRSCRMVELDPRYCDVIVRRWEEYTGRKAELEPA